MVVQRRMLSKTVPRITIKEAILANGYTQQTSSFPNFAALPPDTLSNCVVKSLPINISGIVTYFYYGACPNNYVSFGLDSQGQPLIWRIMRITERGDVRLVLNQTIGSSAYNTNINGDYDIFAYRLSKVKEIVDYWWTSTNLQFLRDTGKIESGVFYNDRQYYGYDSDARYVRYPRYRNFAMYGVQSPQFVPNDPETDGVSVCPGELDYPICLPSLDEAAASGVVQNIPDANRHPWGITSHCWTISASASLSGIFYMATWSTNLGNYPITDVRPIIPVIDIAPYLHVASGDGSSGLPYVVV